MKHLCKAFNYIFPFAFESFQSSFCHFSDDGRRRANFPKGEQAVASVASGYTNIALVNDGATEVPYVAYTESDVAKVKRQQPDSSWTQVGGNVAGSAAYIRIYTDHAGGLYVTYMDGAASNRLAVKKYNAGPNTWEPLDGNNANLYISAGSVNNSVSQYSSTPRSSLAFDSNHTPYIAFSDNGNPAPSTQRQMP